MYEKKIEPQVRFVTFARKIQFSIFQLNIKTGFKRALGQKNFLTKNICIFEKNDVEYDKKDHNDGILQYLKK